MDKEIYLEDPNFCPKCGSSLVAWGRVYPDSDGAGALNTCTMCYYSWWDIYKLVDIEGESTDEDK